MRRRRRARRIARRRARRRARNQTKNDTDYFLSLNIKLIPIPIMLKIPINW